MPYLVVSHRREMFAFELTTRQAKNLEVHADALGALMHKRSDVLAAGTLDDPTVLLTHLVIDNADRQVATAPVTGHVEYLSSESMLGGFATRLMFDLPGGATVSHFDHPMGPAPGSGTIRFRLTPLMSKQVGELPKTLPVFITLCRQGPGMNAPHEPVSNTCAALIDLA